MSSSFLCRRMFSESKSAWASWAASSWEVTDASWLPAARVEPDPDPPSGLAVRPEADADRVEVLRCAVEKVAAAQRQRLGRLGVLTEAELGE